MTKTQVIALLRQNKNQQGIDNWKKLGSKRTGGLKSFGIGLTQLRKIAKDIGRDHKLALQLWNSDIYDAKIVGLLVDDPKVITPEQAEEQVEGLQGGYLAHVFATCDATLAKAPFAFELACRWMKSKDPVRRRCAYSLFYELSKKKNVKGMDDEFLLDRIEHIRTSIHGEQMWVREAMAGALIGIGKRTKQLNSAAVAAAKEIGAVDIDYGRDNQCEPVNILKHLTSEYIRKKLGV